MEYGKQPIPAKAYKDPLEAVKVMHGVHFGVQYDFIAWNETDLMMRKCLIKAMGRQGLNEWVKSIKPGDEIPIAAREDPLEALKVAYRKHVLNDPDIGWEETGGVLKDCLESIIDPAVGWNEDWDEVENAIIECHGSDTLIKDWLDGKDINENFEGLLWQAS